jgi:hypothetical protein
MVFLAGQLFADQTSVERMLKENKGYIEFLNVCITNFGDKEADSFFNVYELHFNGDVSFLQSDYSRAFRSIYNSQNKQTGLFSEVFAKYYLEDSKNLLDKIAPEIIKSKNAAARFYLTLGYRDRAIARNFQVQADAQNPRLFTEKIFRYEEAIKIARRAMRFADLALFESRDTELKKYIYGHLLEMEREKGNIFYTRFLGKTGDAFNQEFVISFDEYEKRFQKEQADKKTTPQTPAATTQPTQGGTAAQQPAQVAVEPKKEEDTFEGKVEREVRFRQEKRVAEYIRDAEFGKADDIITKRVDDFNFKLIQATLEVLAVREKDHIALDYERLKVHHADNFSRIVKPSVLDGFTSKLKVRDDINKKPAGQNPPAQDGTAPKQDSGVKQDQPVKASPQNGGTTTPVTPKTDNTPANPDAGKSGK